MSETTNNYKALSPALRWKSWLIWQIMNQMSLSYDRAYVNGWTAGALPALQYLYEGRDEDLKAALLRTRDYWLCEQTFGSIVYGLYLSMEEKYANNGDFDPEIIRTVKSSLMGPVSGIGDSIMGSTLRQICLLFFLSYAMDGAVWAGPAFFCFYSFVVNLPLFIVFFNKGYEYGKDAVTYLLGTPWLKAITKACGVASMMIMGAMTCKYTTFNIAYVWTSQLGDKSVAVGEMLEKAVPGGLVLLATFIYYRLVGKKTNYILIILVTLAICCALAFFGIV